MRTRRPTFAFLIALALAAPSFAANPYLNRQLGLSIGRADIPCAAAQANNMDFIVNDCATAASCATGGTATAFILCDSGTTVYLAGSVATAASYVPVTADASLSVEATGAGHDWLDAAADDNTSTGNDIIETGVATATRTAPVQTYTASTSTLFTTPKLSVSGVIERAVTDVTVADDAAGTKPAGVTPITTDFVTCTCNDATGCTMSVAEPTPTSGYGRSLTIVSSGTGNCEYADSAGVLEIGAAVVLEPTSVLQLVYANAAWHRVATADNVP